MHGDDVTPRGTEGAEVDMTFVNIGDILMDIKCCNSYIFVCRVASGNDIKRAQPQNCSEQYALFHFLLEK